MPASIEAVLAAAKAENDRWGSSTWDVVRGKKSISHTDDEENFAAFVRDTYCALVGDTPSLHDISNDDYAWSAAGMSYILQQAGYTAAEFKFSASHSTYIRKAVTARQKQDPKAVFWAYRLGETGGEPAVGDLIGYARGKNMTLAKAQTYYDLNEWYKSHTDLVVAVRPGEIDVIGANVLDSVTRKTISISPTGHIADTTFPWFVTLKRHG